MRTVQVPITAELTRDLQRLARATSVPLKSVLLAAHLRVLGLLGGTTDVLTGLVANGRPEERDGERVLGLFLNTLPFRLTLGGGTWSDLIRATFDAESGDARLTAASRWPRCNSARGSSRSSRRRSTSPTFTP